MRCFRLFFILLPVFFCGLYCRAQDTGYVYKDPSLITADSVAAVVEMKKNDRVQTDDADDTLLRNSRISIASDSAEAMKKAKAFGYAKNLDSLLKALQKNQASNVARQSNSPSWLENFFSSPATKVFFWSLAVIFIGFILYKLFFTEGIFQRPSPTGKVTVLPEEESLSAAMDYGKLIAQAVAANNYRLATRYNYLQTLQKLSSKGVIQFTGDKTNYQYITELNGKPYRDDFALLTRSYEYAWYGSFEINEVMFAAIQNSFNTFNDQL